jgi:hypothetical protein
MGGVEWHRYSGGSPGTLTCVGVEGAVLAGVLDGIAGGGEVEICRAAGCSPWTDEI